MYYAHGYMAAVMSNDLIIVESPAKVKTIGRFLGKQYTVEASVGHVRDLPPRELGVDEKRGFAPHYEIIEGKQDVVKRLRAAAKKADHVFLAPDPDREGEAIAWHVAELIKDQNSQITRITFNEITKRAVLDALQHPRALDQRLFDSQQARRVLDRLVGYKISPILWKSVKRGISAGRVQSVALKLIVEREKERRAFTAQEYWNFKARVEGAEPPAFAAELWKIDGKALKPGKFVIGCSDEAEALKARLKDTPFTVATVTSKERKRPAQPPFITSTLQQEGSNRLGFSAKRTMSTAQRLYEGVNLKGRGVTALITYMRTDSVRVAKEAQEAARELIRARWGTDFWPAKPNQYKSKGSAQDAHEAIRPVDVNVTPEDVEGLLPADQFKLYTMIWARFMASQMAPAIFFDTSVEIAAENTLWRAKGERLLFPGWLAAWGRDESEKDAALPKLTEGEVLAVHTLDAKQKFTQPPPRYSEATLVKELEDKGIGRPSTYAQIISTIQDRDYVSMEERHFAPTELGMIVSDQLSKNFGDLIDVGFTATMENDLDAVAEGQRNWSDLIQQFAGGLYQRLDEAETHMKKAALETDIPCPNCGKPMLIRFGKAGEFLGCSGYPDCRGILNFRRGPKGEIEITDNTPPEVLNIICEKCGKPMVIKNSRRGEFLGCSGYPTCRNVKNFTRDENGTIQITEAEAPVVVGTCPECGRDMVIKRSRQGSRFVACTGYPECAHTEPLRTGVKCPREGCTGELVEKVSRRGKVFYSCDQYPKCDFALWNEPVPGPCPDCGSPFLVRKVQRGGKTVIVCPNKDCGHIGGEE